MTVLILSLVNEMLLIGRKEQVGSTPKQEVGAIRIFVHHVELC